MTIEERSRLLDAVKNKRVKGSPKQEMAKRETDVYDKLVDAVRNGRTVSRPSAPSTEALQTVEPLSVEEKEDIKAGAISGLAPKTEAKAEKDPTYFKAGAFEDGYQAGDVTKSVLSTVGDVGIGAVHGVASLVEGITDLGLYGISGISKLIGANDFANKAKELAIEDSVGTVADAVRESTGIKDNSLLGDKGYGIAQAVGQVGGIVGTAGLGGAAGLGAKGASILTSGLMGASSTGSGIGEAYQGGATDGQAAAYGIAKGVIDAGTELIFGGLGKAVNALGISRGISSLDDQFAKLLSSKISNRFFKNAVQYGVKASAEGLEEVLAGIGSAVAKNLTYMPDKSFNELLKDENLLDQFVTGAVASGIAQTGGLITSTKGNRDFITGLTPDQEAAVKKETAERVSETEKKIGMKLSNKQYNEIYDNVVNDLYSGALDKDEKQIVSNSTIKAAKDGNKEKTLASIDSTIEAERKLRDNIRNNKNLSMEEKKAAMDEVKNIINEQTTLKDTLRNADWSDKESINKILNIRLETGEESRIDDLEKNEAAEAEAEREAEATRKATVNATVQNEAVATDSTPTVENAVESDSESVGEGIVTEAEPTKATDSFEVTENAENGTVEVKFKHKTVDHPVRNVLKENNFTWNKSKHAWVGKADANTFTDSLRKAYSVENATPETVGETAKTVGETAVNASGNAEKSINSENIDSIQGINPENIDSTKESTVEVVKEETKPSAVPTQTAQETSTEAKETKPTETTPEAKNAENSKEEAKTEATESEPSDATAKAKRKGKLHNDIAPKNKRQKESLKVLEVLAEALGVDIYTFESPVENGRRVGENGRYDTKTGNIYIDLYAGNNGESVMLYTAAHELTHFIRQWSPDKYNVFTDFLIKQYGEKGVSVDDLVQAQIDKAKNSKTHPRELSYDEALEEVVADSCQAMLTDTDVVSKIAELKAKDESLWEKIRDFFIDLADRIRAAYENLAPYSEEGRAVADMLETAEQLKDMWMGALVEASENYNADGIVEVDTESESASPLLSERTWTESEYVTHRDEMAKKLAKALNVSLRKAKKYIDDVNSVAKMIANDRARLDYEASFGSAFVSNVEYGGSFDYTTLCKKRRIFTGTFTEIQKRLHDVALSPDDILTIRNMLIDKGIEATCGLCYVEGSRANMGKFAKEFIRLYKRDNPDAWIPNMADVNTPDGVEQMRIQHPEAYDKYVFFWNHYGKLKESDPALFASQQKPKLYEARKEYKGEILDNFKDDDTVAKKNRNGGIRMQSFSDFEIVHLIDTMQVIMDMSTVGLAGQAYTKVPEFAEAFGDTGLKINLSLIAKDVDSNGKLVFDNKEGMPHERAFELRDKHSKNVGTIIVTFTDEQLYAAMADDRIDFIIPFHRSQWKKGQYGAMGLPKGTKDYTFMQNEKLIKQTYHEYRGKQVKDKAENYMPNEYWDFSKSGKENAEAYLKMCAENNKRPKFYKLLDLDGNGVYSLKADGSTDGYWKLLIDFKMYDNNGKGSPQNAVVPKFDMEQVEDMLNKYEGGHSKYPVASAVVDEFVEQYNEDHGTKYDDRASQKASYAEKDAAYLEAVERGDMEAAQKMVDEAAKEWGAVTNGNARMPRPIHLYHGTGAFGFTRFRDGRIYATTDTSVAAGYNRGNGLGKVRSSSLGYIPNDGTVETAIKNAKNVLGAKLTKFDDKAKQNIISEADDILKEVSSRITKLDESTDYEKAGKFFEYLTEKYGEDKSIQWTNQLDNLKYMLASEYTADEIAENGEWLKHDLERYHEWKQNLNELWSEEREAVKNATLDKVFRYILGYEYGDALIDIEFGLGRLIDDRQKVVNQNGKLIYLDDVIDSVETMKDTGIYDLFGHPGEKPLVIDEGKRFWDAIPFDGGFRSTDYIVNWAKKNGYTSVLFKTVLDPSSGGSANVYADEWVFFNSNQVKSADPITYDDNGDVIPLSERFNAENNDIRYSARTEDAENRTPDMSDIARSTVKIANARGITVETQDFADMGDNAPEAYWNEASRKIVLNAKAKRNAAMLLGHEMFHTLPKEVQRSIINLYRSEANTDSAEFKEFKADRIKKYKELYARDGRNFTEADFWTEFAAESSETLFTSKRIIEKVSDRRPPIAKQILRWIRDSLRSIVMHEDYTYSAAAKAANLTVDTLRKAENMYAKALNMPTADKIPDVKAAPSYAVNADNMGYGENVGNVADNGETETETETEEKLSANEVYESGKKRSENAPWYDTASRFIREMWHKSTRVMSKIPESGELGKFYSYFRNRVLAYKMHYEMSSDRTVRLMQKMFVVDPEAKGEKRHLSKEEYETFNKVVFFRDLKETAEIQMEKGDPVKLPGGITLENVLKTLDEIEITPRIQTALDNRRAVWDELKRKYIEAGAKIGYDLRGKLLRKDYFRHEVLKYATDNFKRSPKKMKANDKASYLRQRVGSEELINSDFASVEFIALQQMIYDTMTMDNILAEMKKQYDIKPKLVRQAKAKNRAAMDEFIRNEAKETLIKAEEKRIGRKLSKEEIKDLEPTFTLTDRDTLKYNSETQRTLSTYTGKMRWALEKLQTLAEDGALDEFGNDLAVESLMRGELNADVNELIQTIASSDTESDATVPALTYLKNARLKEKFVKETLGDKFATWETELKSMNEQAANAKDNTLASVQYKVFQPRDGRYMFAEEVVSADSLFTELGKKLSEKLETTTETDTQEFLKEFMDENIQTIFKAGSPYEQWVIPETMVEVMTDISNKPKTDSTISKVMSAPLNFWKRWVTGLNPLRAARYHIRNIFGDAEAALTGNAKILSPKRVGNAWKDAWNGLVNGEFTDEFKEWYDMGGTSVTFTIQEMTSKEAEKVFETLRPDSNATFGDVMKRFAKAVAEVPEMANKFNEVRESVLRYSAYKVIKSELNENGGKVKNYYASKKAIVDGLPTIELKAMQLSQDLLGNYGGVSETGQFMRKYFVPFWSFMETNVKRYYRLLANPISGIAQGVKEKDTAKVTSNSAILAKQSAKALAVYMALAIWNALHNDDEEKLPESVRNIPHITLGSVNGHVIAFTRLGNLLDIGEWLGIDDLKIESAEELYQAPIDKAWSILTPYIKMPIELVTGQNHYPSIFNPTYIRDRWQYMFNNLGVVDVYNFIAQKPVPQDSIVDTIANLFVYTYEEESTAYSDAVSMRYDFEGSSTTKSIPTPKSNALYYMKQAMRYGDTKKALKYMNDYFDEGGTGRGLVQSLAYLDPRYGISKEDEEKFYGSMNESDREKFDLGVEFYEKYLELPSAVKSYLRNTKDAEKAREYMATYITNYVSK